MKPSKEWPSLVVPTIEGIALNEAPQIIWNTLPILGLSTISYELSKHISKHLPTLEYNSQSDEF